MNRTATFDLTTGPRLSRFVRRRLKRLGRLRHLHLHNFLLMAGFLAAIAVPAVVTLTQKIDRVSTMERRRLAPKPTLGLAGIADFPEAFDLFVDDNLAFRKNLIEMDSAIKLFGLGVSPSPKFVIGKAGWVFYKAEEAHDGVTIDDYRGLVRFAPAELKRIKEHLEARESYCAARKIPFVTFICPNKDSIYPEYLPDYDAKMQPGTRLDQLEAYLAANSAAQLFDLRPAMLAAKERAGQPLYHEGGTHWNGVGAYYGYAALIERLGTKIPGLRPHPLEDYEIEVQPHSAFDANLPTPTNTYYKLALKPERCGAMGPKRGKALVYGDSFFEYLKPFLEDHFDEVVALSGRTFDERDIEREHPDLVLTEVVERFANRLQ